MSTGPETLPDLVLVGVRDHPDRAAVDFGTHRLTYRELWELAGVVAGHLLHRIGPGVPVGLCAARTPLAYAGYLAAARLGSPVVPLQPTHPVARTTLTCRTARVGLVLVDDEAADRLVGSGLPVGPWSQVRQGHPVQQPADRRPEPDDTAYVLFTSGSTGTPKGVPIRHRSAAAYLRHVVERYEVGPGSRLSHTFDLTFDPSVFDLFAAWSGGGTLVVPQGNELVQPARHIRERGVTHWFSVPSAVTLARALRGIPPGAMPELRWSMFIGDQFSWEQAAAWRAAAPAGVIENVYGPTELTVACTGYRVPADPADWIETSNGTVPIGPVYPHLEHLVLDGTGRPADEGELCVRGVQRFGGYLDPAHDRGSFLDHRDGRTVRYDGADPLTAGHWYRTGDRVRFEHGELVHLGRLDRQVQINGCRVELGEVEAVLRRHPTVADAAVVPAEGRAGLWAYCTGSAADPAMLSAWLRDHLPSYMVPSRIRILPRLPLNENGKVDRRQLLARD
ncbi:amino acid adenylation domain-containing protein [Plantactinospora sp. CA-294935]|uniref:amino acid adenylation domain-containing protein n=1 Tax=Plantactinospora sp. CA-294935 TaxID=3240012 RepID=UPI003D9458C3